MEALKIDTKNGKKMTDISEDP